MTTAQPANIARGQRFSERRRDWRTRRERIGRHAPIEAHLDVLAVLMFDRAEAVPSPCREYEFYTAETHQLVRINCDNWQWFALDASAEGRGLYELYAWRFDMTVGAAYAEIWACLPSWRRQLAAATAPKARRAEKAQAAA